MILPDYAYCNNCAEILESGGDLGSRYIEEEEEEEEEEEDIHTSSSTKNIKKAISLKDDTDADFYIDAISNNLNSLYYTAFLPQAEALKQRSYKNIKVLFQRRDFQDMMSEEILNELSNILGDQMKDIDEADMASIKSYIYTSVIPEYINKYLLGN